MNRRSFLTSLTIAPFVVAALAACGDPDQQSAATEPTTPPTSAVARIDHPTGPDDVVLKLSYEGGLVPVGYDLTALPSLLVTGDGRVFQPAAVPAIYPGPLLPSVGVRSITEAGIQALLAVVQQSGLLAAPPDYAGGGQVADGTTTVLTISAGGGTFVHSAYALGLAGSETGARQQLVDAVSRLSEVDAVAGTANLGSSTQFVATAYRLMARPVDPAELTGQDLPPTVVDWPAAAGIALVSATACVRVDAAAVGSLFTDAKQNTYFKDADVVYQVSVRGVLPGDPAC